MKKTLSLILALTLLAALAVPALATEVTTGPDVPVDGEVMETTSAPVDTSAITTLPDEVKVEDVPIPQSYVGSITVDGTALDLSAIPGAPVGYIPMRAFCDAMGSYVDWFAEDNEAFFTVDNLGVVVNLSTLAVTCDFEPVEGVKAYLDPAGYTFLPVTFLTTFPNIKVDDHPEMDSIHFDFTTKPERSALETVADSVAEAAQVGATMQLDASILADFGIEAENFVELVALYPMMSANVSSVYVGEVVEGKIGQAESNLKTVSEFLMQNFGNYPACAEMIQAGKLVTSPDGSHIMLLVAPEVDAGVAVFEAAFPSLTRPTRG